MTDKGIFTVAKLCKRLKTANVTNCTFTKKMTNYLKIKRGLRWRLVIAKTKKANAPTVEMKYWPTRAFTITEMKYWPIRGFPITGSEATL